MKRKIFSVFIGIMLLLSPIILSACGDRYENMEFKISYAFSEDSSNWLDATNGISVTYGGENDSLKIDENLGYGVIYVRVEIANVKAKYIDDIIITTSGVSSGLSFSTASVKQNQVFALRITDNVKTNLKFYETNSQKATNIGLSVSRSITGIEVDTFIKPAVVVGDNVGLALMQVNNLTYLPANKTDQTGVRYSIDSVGAYNFDGASNQNVYVATSSTEGVSITSGGVLTVSNDFVLSDSKYIARIKATSLYNEEIFAYFDVYIVDRILNTDQSLYVPDVKYSRTASNVGDNMTLYVGNSYYNTSQISIDYNDFSSFYSSKKLTIDGSISYGIAVYVDDKLIDFDTTETINGLIVENRDGVIFITAIDAEIKTNVVRFALTLNGVEYFTSTEPRYEKQVTLTKEILPTSIRINGETIENGGSASGVVYGTKADYAGLELILSTFPENSSNDYLIIESVNGSLNNLNITGNALEHVGNSLRLRSGEMIRILFNDGVSEKQSILIKVLASPSNFEGENVNETYLSATYVLNKVITADSINVYSNYSNGTLSNPIQNENLLINARDTSSFYVQVYYTGTVLDASTITLYSSNDAILFSNRSNVISLNDSNVELEAESVRDSHGNVYNVYKVGFLPTASIETTNINITAGDENITVGAEFSVNSVYLLDEENISFNLSNDNGMQITNENLVTNDDVKYFAVVKDGYLEVSVLGRTDGSMLDIEQVISSISLVTNTNYATGNYSTRAITYNVVSSNMFSLTANIGGKTQVLMLTIHYYAINSATRLIEEKTKNIQLEFAVYDPIQSISLTADPTDITYINSKFEDASSARISVVSSASSAIPSSKVTFTGGSVENASQLRLSFNRQLNEYDYISILIDKNGEFEELDLSNSQNGYILTDENNQDSLNCNIVVRLKGTPTYSSITLVVEALRFGKSSNVAQTITINFADYEYVEGVVVSGNSIVNEGVDSNYIYMSFIDVENGYDEVTFTARARYNSTEPQDGYLRFGNLTYVLYQVDQDNNNGQIIMENGEIKLDLVQTERLDVIFNEDSTVVIRADKLLGGGLFKLVIVPQDSYNDETHMYNEDNGTSLFIMISDGKKQNPYIISTEEELNYINNDLDASYVLSDNIVLSDDFISLGTINNNEQTLVSQFNGTLSGTRQMVGSNNQIISSVRYSITLSLPTPVLDGDGNAYSGLFTILGKDAEISNLDIISSYIGEYTHANENTNLYVGALAGVNNGSISGVSLIISGRTSITSTTSTYFGGLVGNNKGVINLDSECVEFNNVKISTSNTKGLNIGLVAGLNAGEISGNYVDKVGLNNIVFNVISDLTIYSNANNVVINAGGVAGENYNGVVKNLLIGGSIEVQNNTNYSSTGYVGGVVGVNNFEAGENITDKYIDSCTVIGLDLISSSIGINLAGIAGSSSGYKITNVRFISANTTFNNARTTVGKIEGAGVVAGIIANSFNDTIEYASLQNFVSGEDNNGVVSDFYTLSSVNDQVYGLVNGATSTISNSFVQANIAVNNNTTSSIYLTSNGTEINTYFLGKVQNFEGEIVNTNVNSDFNIVYTDNAMYSITNGTASEIDLTNGVFDETIVEILSEVALDSLMSEAVVTSETFEELKTNLYILNDNVFIKLNETSVFVEGTTYYSLNNEVFSAEIVKGLIGIDHEENVYQIANIEDFNVEFNYYNINTDYLSVADNKLVLNQEFNNLYIKENNRYLKANENIEVDTDILAYLQSPFVSLTFNEEEWINIIKANTHVYEGDALKSNYTFENDGVIIKNNFIQIQDLNYYLPYLINEDNIPVIIIRPTDISANINENYVIDIDSIYVDKEIETNEIRFIHSAIINYHNSTNPLNNTRLNTYNLVNTAVDGEPNGLIDVSVLPIDASSGLYYEVVSGMNYAYIVNNAEIVFTGVSGGTPIIVRAYSLFDDSVEAYIAFYTYLGITDLNISASNVEVINDPTDDADYELTTFIGSNAYLISLEAENNYQGQECSTIFDLNRVDEFVSVEFEKIQESIIDIQSTLAVDTVRLGIKENAQFDGNRWEETITIKLIFNLTEYFKNSNGVSVYPQINGVDQTIEIDRVVLRVIVFKSANAVEISGSGYTINTEGNLNFNASLYTGYVLDDENAPTNRHDIKSSISQGIVSLDDDTDNKDSITLSFDIISGEREANSLMSKAGVNSFAELFDYNFDWQVMESSGLTVGYNYTISMALKDEFSYRYITSEIEFAIIISAWSNSQINDNLLITLTPTTLSSARIENYTATDISSNNNYVNLITSSSTETSIIAPGGLGGVMLIYLEPAYSNIISATLTSSTLFVPSLNKDVRINFEQLVYNTDTNSYQTILSSAEPVEGGIQLRLVSTINNSGEESYNGVIYIHTQLDKFSGLSSTITATLTVETGSASNPTVTVTKPLLTRYLPGASLNYDGITIRENEYIIQEDTYSNTMDISVYGYQFNSQPNVNVEWYLSDTTKYRYQDYKLSGEKGKITEEEFNEKFNYLFTFNNNEYVKLSEDSIYDANEVYYEPVDRGVIVEVDNENNIYYVANYITARIEGNYANLSPNADGSYTMQVLFNVQPNTPTSFKITASQSLTTDESVIVTERSESLVFHPVRAVLKEIYFENLNNNTMNLVINHSNTIDFAFSTTNDLIDLNSYIYNRLLECFTSENELDVERFVGLFHFVNASGSDITLTTNEADASINHPQFSVRVVNNQLVLTGLETFNNTIEFRVHYGYKYNDENAKYELTFGTMSENSLTNSINSSFNLIIVPSTSETNAIPIYSASDMVDEEGNTRLVEGTDYILMNDITLDLVQPIDVSIASFDGNNRVIKINSFAVSSEQTNYGLFARIGTYTRNDQEEKTILKNIIVDYSGFNSDNNGILALTGLNSVTFGGLVAINEGGLIYNCDVMNLSNTTKTINLVTDASMQNLTFGGLVGENQGTITNSRVGRMDYTRIEADANTQTERIVSGETLMFVVGDNTSTDTKTANGFVGVSGGFVGNNSGVIASSYMANTSLINLSTADSLARTAGFAGTNSGTINYSYVKAREDTISYNSPSATGAYIRAATNGNVAGFVHVNSGTITNSFANTELITTSAFMAGFVYQNSSTGVISECYAACTLNGSNNSLDVSEQPFVGIDEAGILLSDGQIENSYFLISDNYTEIVEQEGKAQAIALNTENFIDSDKLTGFVFINSTSQTERNQGVWAYYLGNTSVVLPELTNTNIVAHSYRYLVDVTDNEDYVTYNYTNAINYTEGSANNPYIIRDVDEFNEIMTRNSTEANRSMTGYVRFIDDIDFASNSRAIQTRVNFTLGDVNNRAVTSIDGNGMNISGIYLDVLDATSATDIGLFSRVENAYIKNLNLNFVSTTLTDDQFSSVSVQYSGGLAGRINNSVIINVDLDGSSTTIAGRSFAGGLAGVITGNSMIYGIETNLSVKAVNTDSNYYMYYNEADFNTMKGVGIISYGNYSDYLANLSYAGGVAGVIDIVERQNINFNLSYINVLGTEMYDRSQANGNIQADYAGGVAGYINNQTNALRVKFIVGTNNLILGQRATGGLFAVARGKITASQVSAPEEIQYNYDTAFGKYATDLLNGTEAVLDQDYGNLNLLEGYGYVGGLVGISIGTTINSSYSKASIRTGEVVGGLIGTSYASKVVYSYAVPYINLEYNTDIYKEVGGLIGSAYGVRQIGTVISRNNKEYEAIALRLNNIVSQDTDLQFTFSTILLDNDKLTSSEIKFDYISANYRESEQYITSNKSETLAYVFAGLVNYDSSTDGLIVEHSMNSIASDINLDNLFDIYGTNIQQETIFYEVFSGWSEEYWTLDSTKYYPLLLNKRVSNYIEIETADDFYKIINNETGNFKIVNDIDMTDWCIQQSGNFILDVNFQGVLVGEKADGSGTPTLYGLTINARNTGNAGFFSQTTNATIRNIKFEWDDSKDDMAAIQINNTVSMVGMISSSDNGSLFSNLSVTTKTGESNMIATTNRSSISGFGGIIGNATNSNVLNCSYVGNLNASINTASGEGAIGGLVGSATRDTNSENQNEENATNMTISSSYVGSPEFKTTFTFKISSNVKRDVYIGGLVGKAEQTSISSVRLGTLDRNIDTQRVDIVVELENNSCNTVVSGGIAWSKDTILSSATILANITVSGEQGETTDTTTVNTFVAGAVGELQQTGTTENAQISSVGVTANINLSKLNVDKLNTSLGVAFVEDGSSVKIESSLFTGNVNSAIIDEETDEATDSENIITSMHYGGIVAQSESAVLTISESMAYVEEVNIGSIGTSKLYAGGLVGSSKILSIINSLTAGRIYPRTSEYKDGASCAISGVVGQVSDNLVMNNVISLESIFLNKINNTMLPYANTDALFVRAEDNLNVVINNTYYSSDLSLVTQNNGFGTNITANLLINTSSLYLPTLNPDNVIVWAKITGNGALESVPYIASLEELLINHSILDPTQSGYTYKEGTVFKPYVVSTSGSEYIMEEDYAYYLLSSNLTTLPKFTAHENNSHIIKGFIIGGETSYSLSKNGLTDDNNNHSGIFASIDDKSAVSNIHLNLKSSEDSTTVTIPNNVVGLVVGLNKGVMYNISVQGTGLILSSTGTSTDIGLVAGSNQGLIYNAYSTVEILAVTGSMNCLSAIVSQNNGKIAYSYFTGYINNKNDQGAVVSSAGIIGTISGNNSYAYNCYMAGIIESLSANGNSFYAYNQTNGVLSGENNYVDSLANIEYWNTNSTGIISTNTLNIMNGKALKGSWDIIFKCVDNIDAGYYIDPTSPTYGYNYGYPVFNDYKQFSATGDIEDLTYNPTAYQLYTGTGSNDKTITTKEQLEIEPDISNFPSDSDNEKRNEYSDNIYKIPHLGVLSSIQGLTYINTGNLINGNIDEFINTKLNYMIIYDLDGAQPNNNIDWNAVGRSTTSLVESSTDLYYKVSSGNKFNGLVISNKNFAYLPLEKDNLDNLCIVTNLSNNGLFANIDNAYIGYIKLGNFLELNNSGALGTNVQSIINKEVDATATTVTVQNIYFTKTKRDTLITISGLGSSETQNYIGGLFGEISSGNVEIDNIQTTTINESVETVSVALENTSYAGLISGLMSGGSLYISKVSTDLGEVEQSLSVQFGNIKYAGGLIGCITGGSVVGNDSKINLYAFTSEKPVDILGGIIGLAQSSTTAMIEKLIVVPSTSEANILYINCFGGLVGEINGNITLSDCKIHCEAFSNINTINVESYFGLVTSKLSGGTSIIKNFSHEGNVNIEITASAYSQEDKSGFGILIGKSEDSSEINISLGNSISTILTVKNGTNVGGILGWYNGGTINITKGENNATINVTLTAVTNVGGAIGLVTADINNITDVTDSQNWNFLDSDVQYAKLVTPTTITTLQNWGGLFGKVSTDNLYLYTADNESDLAKRTIHDIVNYNEIEINSAESNNDTSNNIKLVNVGGVVGFFEGKIAIKLINRGSITHNSRNSTMDGYNNYNEGMELFQYSNGANKLIAFKSLNVGGVIGYVSENVQYLYSLQNFDDITGYQNVGGLIGYMSAGILQSDIPEKISINNNEIEFESNSPDNIYVKKSKSEVYTYNFKRNEIIEDYEIVDIQYELTQDSDEVDLYVLDENAISVSFDAQIAGVLNVGGAVGLLKGGTIDSIWTQANVYGNTSVGGLVGYSDDNENSANPAIIKNNIIGAVLNSEVELLVDIKGVYLASYERNNVTALNEWKYVIPTSVGGLIGSSLSGEISYNNLLGVTVTSSTEGNGVNDENASSISTIENYIANLSFTDSSNNVEYTNINSPYSNFTKDGNKHEFNDLTSGFGGFIGSVNMNSLYKYEEEEASSAINLASTNNIDVDINASLGVNVGTFYGYYYNTTTGDDDLPMLLLPKLLENVNVSGAYNIGGIVGYYDGSSNSDLINLSNADIEVNSALESGQNEFEIHVQNTGVGMYVGGLIGKLTMNARGLQIVGTDENKDVQTSITIHTDSSYYIGGLIGRLEGNLTEGDKLTNENNEEYYTNPNSVSGLKVTTDDTTNFGGLVGMLKVAKGGSVNEGYERRSVTVQGEHNFPFTVNTIENSNYADGQSSFTADTSDGYINLIAQAYYVNLDTFNISASNTVPYSNPLNKTAINETEYTVENHPTEINYAEWMQKGNISGWAKEYTTFRTLQRNIPREDNPGNEWDSIAVVYDAANITKVGTIKNLDLSDTNLLNPNGDGKSTKTFDEDYICYTIYEEMEGSPTLYSAIGIASPCYNLEGNYGEPIDNKATFWAYLGMIFSGRSPGEVFYISVNKNDSLKGLTYFNWQAEYNTIGKDKASMFGKDAENHTDEETAVFVTYDVGYYDGAENVYFNFDTLYHNKTLNGEYTKDNTKTTINIEENHLPIDGSIFNVSGANSAVVAEVIDGLSGGDSWWYWLIWAAILVFEIVITVATGGWAAVAKTGAKAILKYISKQVVKVVANHGIAYVIGGILIENINNHAVAKNTYYNKVEQSFGFFSSTYDRQILYKNSILSVQDQNIISDDHNQAYYVYYSTERPADYFNKYYFYYDPIEKEDSQGAPIVLNNEGINNNGNDGRIVKIKTDSSPMVIESITIGDIEYTRDGDGVSKNSVDWEIYRYYIYKNGVYYKLADACEIVNSPVQAHIDTSNFTQGDYIIHDGYIYVRGQYDDKNSSYNNYENDVNNNLVEKPDGTFSSNGKPWGEGVTAGLSPDVTQAQVFKLVSSTYGYDENDNVLIYKYTNDKQEEITIEYHLGYSYMRDAYYTAKATPNNIDIATKIAKFTWTTDKPNDYSEDTEGIDYIQVNYEETVIGEDGSQTVEPRTGYYVIDSVVEDSDGNQIYSYGQTLPHNGNDIYIYIYPYSFTNPYNKQIDNINVQDSNFYTIDSAETAVQISHTPTYYYYDGGYVTNGSSVYELIPDKYLGSGDSSLPITIYNEAGESDEITLNDLKEDYATYSDWYIVDTSSGDYSNLTDKSLYKVGYNYYVKNGKLYTLSTTYSIQDGVCVVSQMIANTDDNKQILYNYNKYLTDEEIGLYTRYIYTGRLLMPQSITTDNLFEEEGNNGRYYTFPKNNNGRLYRLTESVCVSVGGSANLRFCETGNNTIIDQIIVDAGGVKVL